jgi:hypothetical protein
MSWYPQVAADTPRLFPQDMPSVSLLKRFLHCGIEEAWFLHQSFLFSFHHLIVLSFVRELS